MVRQRWFSDWRRKKEISVLATTEAEGAQVSCMNEITRCLAQDQISCTRLVDSLHKSPQTQKDSEKNKRPRLKVQVEGSGRPNNGGRKKEEGGGTKLMPLISNQLLVTEG